MKKYHKKIVLTIAVIFTFLIIIYLFLPPISLKELVITYPYDGALFPPDIAQPTFRWNDSSSGAEEWHIEIEFEDTGESIPHRVETLEWTPEREVWENIKKRSIEKNATVTLRGFKKSLIGKLVTRNKNISESSITFSTSIDSVGAPIFYRDVPLPFDFAREKMEIIQWRLGDISRSERPPIVLQNLPVCGNCHSFAQDGSTLAMDVDSGGDKGSYAITPIEKEIFLTREKLITWSDYKREEGDPTFGLLARVSPDGRYVASAVKDRVIFLTRQKLEFSQLFFPVKGIIAIYDRKTQEFFALQGADDPDYVQANPSWSPDGKYVLFARTPATDFIKNDKTKNAVLTRRQSAIVLGGESFLEDSTGGEKYMFNIYRVPFNDGKGGEIEPVRGASNNDKSNYFARYSPDGKWMVFCQAMSFMLLQPDSKLYIMPADFSSEPRLMNCNTSRMNSYHSWSPNSKWLVFSSKENSAYTDLYLTHIDEEGNDTPPVLLSSFSSTDRARNIPEFVNIKPDDINQIHESFVDYYSYARKGDKLLSYAKYEEAEKSYRMSIELKPDFALSHRNLGSLLSMMNRLEEAEKEFEIAVNLNPKDPVALYNIGTIYLNKNDYEKSRKTFDACTKIDPLYGPAYEGIAMILYHQEDYEGALELFEKAVKLDPELPDSHYYLGVLHMRDMEYEKAIRPFETALQYINDPEIYSRLGTIYTIIENYDQAEKEFRKALTIDSNNLGVLHNLGITYMYKKEYAQAEQIFRRVYRANPNNPNVSFMLGKALSMNDRTISEAVLMYENTILLMPSNVEAYIDLGNLYIKTGDYQRALNRLEKALELSPNSPELRDQIEQLKQQQ